MIKDKIRVVMPSKDRADIISAHLLFSDPTVFVHNKEQYDLYAKRGDIKNLVNMNKPYGMCNARNGVLENLPDNEWFLMVDDDLQGFMCPDGEIYSNPNHDWKKCDNKVPKEIRENFNQKISMERFWEVIQDMIDYAEARGIRHCGVASNDNVFFRGKKYRTVGFCVGLCTLTKKVPGLLYDPEITVKDDYAMSAEQVLRYGGILINNYLRPIARNYAKGGVGSYEARLDRNIADCQYIMKKYPGYYRQATGRTHNEAEIVISLREQGVQKWRKDMILKRK